MKYKIISLIILIVCICIGRVSASEEAKCTDSSEWRSKLDAVKPAQVQLKEVLLCKNYVDIDFIVKPYKTEAISLFMESIDLYGYGKPRFQTLGRGDENSILSLRVDLNE